MKIKVASLLEVSPLFALGIYSIVDGVRLVVVGKLKLYDVLGPGWYNIGMGAVLVITGLAYLIPHLMSAEEIKRKVTSRENQLQMLYMILSLFGYAALILIAGYLVASIIFFPVILKISGIKSWWVSIAAGIVMTIAFYIIFVKGLDVLFPEGSLLNIG